jgi:hypothetical protein
MTRKRLPGTSIMSHALDITPILGIPVLFDPSKLVIPVNEARVITNRTYHERDTRWSVIWQRADGRVTATGFLTEKAALTWACARAAVTQVLPE